MDKFWENSCSCGWTEEADDIGPMEKRRQECPECGASVMYQHITRVFGE